MSETAELFDAIQQRDLGRVQELVGRDPSLAAARNQAGISAVLQARYNSASDLLQFLLEANPELDLFEAAAVGRKQRVAELLARDLALALAYSPDGFTALHLAAFFGHPEIAALLLEAGADANALSKNAMSLRPLHSAAATRQRTIVEMLLVYGADPNIGQQGGWTPLHAAAHHGDLETARLLLSKGASKDAKNDEGKTPLDMALAGGHQAVAVLLRSA